MALELQPPLFVTKNVVNGGWKTTLELTLPENSVLYNITLNPTAVTPPLLVQFEVEIDGNSYSLGDLVKLYARSGGKYFHAFWNGDLQLSNIYRPIVRAHVANWTGNDVVVKMTVLFAVRK